MSRNQKAALRALGYFAVNIIAALAVYQTFPTSWSEFGSWVWQPIMNGSLAAFASLGINKSTSAG